MKKNILNILSLISISLLIVGNVQAQNWTIDPELKDAQLKIAYDEASIDAGKSVYDKNCKACHLEISAEENNSRAAGAAPNLGNKEFNKGNTDGEIFCKLSHGNGSSMPPYEAMLSEDDRWKVIAYMRSFCESYEGPKADDGAAAVVAEKFEGEISKLDLSFDKDSKVITVQLEGKDSSGNKVVPKNVKVSVFVKRAFGQLPLCADKKTDDKGQITTELGDVPTDTAGFITLIASVNGGKTTAEANVQVNEGYTWVNPLDGTHLWATRDKTPLWLMIMYFGGTLLVLGVIGWSVLQLFRIWNLRER
ncbi:MAG: cytochrome c [Bacteroidales bacterium]|nr:cytochrome c [Bacteroidales bacterium]